jgi:putative pyruvate formate lyase activating enzyme
MTHPDYHSLYESGQLQGQIDRAGQLLTACTLCPRQCRVDRTAENLGICKTGAPALVADFSPHFGEERPLVANTAQGPFFLPAATCSACFARTSISVIMAQEPQSPAGN